MIYKDQGGEKAVFGCRKQYLNCYNMRLMYKK